MYFLVIMTLFFYSDNFLLHIDISQQSVVANKLKIDIALKKKKSTTTQTTSTKINKLKMYRDIFSNIMLFFIDNCSKKIINCLT